MYTKNKTNRITLRLDDKQFDFIKATADVLGVSPSEFLRMVVNSTMVMQDSTAKKGAFGKKGGQAGRENDKADSND